MRKMKTESFKSKKCLGDGYENAAFLDHKLEGVSVGRVQTRLLDPRSIA